jgi:Zn-dependent protease/CBS domain-containing protein
MRWSFKIGEVSGIDIKIHFTFLFIVIWAAAQGASGAGGVHGALFAAVSILLLFACITLHELGHSLVARRLGIQVRDITLLPIGGIAQLVALPRRPLQELLIALAGPAVNFALAIGLGLALALVGGAGVILNPRHLSYMLMEPRNPLSLLVYLLAANLVLGLFNLVPAFPMDGGRVLRSLLAMWTSYPRATHIAARVGQLMAVGFALLALSPIGSFMLVLVALFVFTGASFEDQTVQARAALHGLRVRHALPMRTVRAVSAEDTLANVMEMGFRNDQHDFPVVRGGTLVGILSRDDLLTAIRQGGGYMCVEQAMQREFPSVSPDAPLLQAQQLIAQTGLSALPVFDQSYFLGLISLEDINRAYANLSWRRR